MNRIPRPEGLSSATMRSLRDHWLRLRGDRRLPARRDIDPLAMPRSLLPYVVLTDVLHEPVRFRYRLIGTFVTGMAGRNATGRWLDEALYGKGTADMLWAYHRCIERLEPVAVREKVQFAPKEWLTIEALLLPVGDSDDRADLVLSGVDKVPAGAETPPPRTAFVLDWRLG